jgi:hypothetical protein
MWADTPRPAPLLRKVGLRAAYNGKKLCRLPNQPSRYAAAGETGQPAIPDLVLSRVAACRREKPVAAIQDRLLLCAGLACEAPAEPSRPGRILSRCRLFQLVACPMKGTPNRRFLAIFCARSRKAGQRPERSWINYLAWERGGAKHVIVAVPPGWFRVATLVAHASDAGLQMFAHPPEGSAILPLWAV